MKKYVTAHEYYQIANVERSILQWQGYKGAMTKSNYRARVAMDEVDEPVEFPAYDAINTAGFFGIITAMDTLYGADHNRHISDKRLLASATSVAIQLLFGLLTNNDDMAGLARWIRTGFIGSSSQSDIDHVPALNKYIRKMTKLSDSFVAHVELGTWNVPLSLSNGDQMLIEQIVELEGEEY